jgi:iron complex outermembrane receptor protein
VLFRSHYDRDSYFTSDTGKANSASGRLKYLYQPSDTLRFLVGGEITKRLPAAAPMVTAWGLGDYPAGDPYDNLTRDGGLTGSLRSSGSSDDRYAKVWAQVDWETPIGTVTYLPTYNEREDNDVSVNLQNMFVPDILKTTWIFTKSHQNSFEARLASSGESAFDYVLGIFYLDAEWSEVYILTGGATEDLTMVGQGSEAVFGQGTYHFTDRLRGTLGLRYTRDTKDYYTTQILYGNNAANGGKKAWDRADWKVGLEMDILDGDGLLYADVATGYRPGTVNTSAARTGFDAAGNVIDYPNQFTEPEKLLAYEMGAKTSFFNKRLTVNLDAYYYNYTNRQYTELFPMVPLDQLCPSGTKPSEKASMIAGTGLCYEERNMGKVVTYGAELSSIMHPTDNDTINLSVAYLKAYVAESQMILVHSSGIYADANGATMPNSPKLQVNLGWEHRFDFEPGSLLLRGDGRYTSKSFVQDFSYLAPLSTTLRYPYPSGVTRTYSIRDLYTCEAHTSYDFTATFLTSEGGYTFSAYVKNITNEYWKLRTDGTRNTISEPRTYGVICSARF